MISIIILLLAIIVGTALCIAAILAIVWLLDPKKEKKPKEERRGTNTAQNNGSSEASEYWKARWEKLKGEKTLAPLIFGLLFLGLLWWVAHRFGVAESIRQSPLFWPLLFLFLLYILATQFSVSWKKWVLRVGLVILGIVLLKPAFDHASFPFFGRDNVARARVPGTYEVSRGEWLTLKTVTRFRVTATSGTILMLLPDGKTVWRVPQGSEHFYTLDGRKVSENPNEVQKVVGTTFKFSSEAPDGRFELSKP